MPVNIAGGAAGAGAGAAFATTGDARNAKKMQSMRSVRSMAGHFMPVHFAPRPVTGNADFLRNFRLSSFFSERETQLR
jgi:hypothetical protein